VLHAFAQAVYVVVVNVALLLKERAHAQAARVVLIGKRHAACAQAHMRSEHARR